MAKSLNKVQLIGRAGLDPELKYTTNGTAYCRFTMATDDTYLSDGKEVIRTEWHNINVWGKLAEICSVYVKKGSHIYVEGKIKSSISNTEANRKYYSIEIYDLILLDKKPTEEKSKDVFDKDEPSVNTEELPF